MLLLNHRGSCSNAHINHCYLLIKLIFAFQSLVRFVNCELTTITTNSQLPTTSQNISNFVYSDHHHKQYQSRLVSSNEHTVNKPTLPTLDVTDLQIIPELRAAKLSWNYQIRVPIRPTAFSIKYCELTSWNDEIKCRNKELEVRQDYNDDNYDHYQTANYLHQQVANLQPITNIGKRSELLDDINANSKKDNFVINNPQLTGQIQTKKLNPIQISGQISDNNNPKTTSTQQPAAVLLKGEKLFNDKQSGKLMHLSNYEAHIYDLRAQTNYTFQVQVLKFNDLALNQLLMQSNQDATSKLHHQLASRATRPTGRRLSGQWLQQQPQTSDSIALNEISDSTNNVAQNANNNNAQLLHNSRLLSSKIAETKAFAAEATRCLADVSEVVVNTGRHFGGRISVEDSQDPRCQLLGNRSSDQTSYLFRIDHELCHSKLVDGNHIETIVLVHENKDILTHNTARFLVLCNFLQNSFTLKASVSLPKVNGLMSHNSRQHSQHESHQDQPSSLLRSIPANITQLASKPLPSTTTTMTLPTSMDYTNQLMLHRDLQQENQQATLHKPLQQMMINHDQPVRLGSMPGIFRSKHHTKQQQHQQPRNVAMENTIKINNSNLATNGRQIPTDFTNTIDQAKIIPSMMRTEALSLIAPNELLHNDNNASFSAENSSRARNFSARARSLQMQMHQDDAMANNDLSAEASDSIGTTATGSNLKALVLPLAQPEPVQVQSQVLFISPPQTTNQNANNGLSSQNREARQLLPNGISLIRSAASLQKFQEAAAAKLKSNNNNQLLTRASGSILNQKILNGDLQEQIGINQPAGMSTTANDQDLGLMQVFTNNHRISDNFPSLSTPPQPTTPLKMATTTSVENGNNFDQNYTIKYSAAPDVDNYSVSDQVGIIEPPSTSSKSLQPQLWTPIVEVSGQSDPMQPTRMAKSLIDEHGNSGEQQQFTLAQNITNQLLKFSLKTLTNVARKTVELLVKGAEQKQIASADGAGSAAAAAAAVASGDNENDDILNRSSLAGHNNQIQNKQSDLSSSSMTDEDDYDESDQPANNNESNKPIFGADTPIVQQNISHNNNQQQNHSHNQGREHVILNKLSNEDTITTSTSKSSSGLIDNDSTKAADGNTINNAHHDDLTKPILITPRPLQDNLIKKSNENNQSTRQDDDDKSKPSQIIIIDNDNNQHDSQSHSHSHFSNFNSNSNMSNVDQDNNHDSLVFDINNKNNINNNHNDGDQIITAAAEIALSSTIRPQTPRLTTRFSGDDNQATKFDRAESISSTAAAQMTTSSQNLQHSKVANAKAARLPSAVFSSSSHRSSGSRSLKHPTEDDSLIKTDVSTLNGHRSREIASHESLSNSQKFNQVFEFRESPTKRHSLMYWPLFCLIVLACIASAFVISIWFVSFKQQQQQQQHSSNNNNNGLFGATFNGCAAGAANNLQNCDSNNNQNQIPNLLIAKTRTLGTTLDSNAKLGQRNVAESSGISPKQKSTNKPRPHSVNNNAKIDDISDKCKRQMYPHGNNSMFFEQNPKKSTKNGLNYNITSSNNYDTKHDGCLQQAEITTNNDNNNYQQESNLILEDVEQQQQQQQQQQAHICMSSEKIYATSKISSVNNNMTNSMIVGANVACCERALSPSIRTLSPSFPYKTNNNNHIDDYEHYKSCSIGFENNRSKDNFVMARNTRIKQQKSHFYDDNFAPTHPIDIVKQVNNIQNNNKSNNNNNINGIGEQTRQIALQRPRSHCSSRGSDKTNSTENSRSRFSQSPSISNGSTTLMASSLSTEINENLCKDNELLFSDHVLINLGSHRGESYA